MRKVLVAAGWAWAATIVWLSLMPEPPELSIAHGDKLGHFAAYGLLMLWFTQLYAARGSRLAYAAVFVAMGVTLEFVQGALGYRSYDVFDMYANTIGVVLGWALGALFRPRFPRPAGQPRL
ncbi:MAG TPA: VanZ family protein [Burkholderiales bacterium]|nr:VanZ family protein [Burkholderiales bacterium]